ncbi:histidine kinase [Paenibacillus yanchengensis]|uniref:Histidine kinase n=1 Tax=Paenibacillus yanchengensis TaxID=2035833 RepID=A0ABW4YIP0_9BACL
MMQLIKSSLQKKLVLFLLTAVIVPISISIFVTYHYTKKNVQETSIAHNTALLNQGSSNIGHYMQRIHQVMMLIYQDASNKSSFYQIAGKQQLSYADEQSLYVALQFIMNSVAEAKQVYVHLDRPQQSYRFSYSLLRSATGETFDIDDYMGKQTSLTTTDYYLQPTHTSHTYDINKFSFEVPEQVMTFHQQILNSPSDKTIGTFALDVKPTMINQISASLYAKEQEQFYLLHEDGSVLYASESLGEQPLAITTDWLNQLDINEQPSGYLHVSDEQFSGIHLYKTIETPFANLIMLKRIPAFVLTQNAKQLTVINSLIVVACLIVAVIATIYISVHFTAPIKQLLRYMNKIEFGQMEAPLHTNRTDEIGILSRRFHQLIQRLNLHINKEYRLELANRTNQLKALQAQVQPHFMNNALQSIGTLALQNKQKKIYQLIAALGKMMRYQMNTNEALVPLQSELDYVRAYLALQSQRFDDKLTFHFDIDEQTKATQVPKMILQPIVENCFKHGFIAQNNMGEITIMSEWIQGELDAELMMQRQSELRITIMDNGIGIDGTALETLQFKLNHLHAQPTATEQSGIGLVNVLARLQLYFSEQAAIRVAQQTPHGLQVTLIIPMAEEGEQR